MSSPIDLSVCMIVKNEADNLLRSLESVIDIAEQIVVVDTGSTDNTVNVARRYGAEVYFFPWNESFSEARNHSLAFARARWILIMDADDELVKEDVPVLKDLLNTKTAEAFFLRTINSHSPHGVHRGTHHLTLRLFRNRPQYRYVGRIHESVIPSIVNCAGHQAIKVVPEVRVIHYGYSKREVENKNKIHRNLKLLTKELESRIPDSFLYYNLGVEYFRLGDYAKALEFFEQAETTGLRWETAFAPSLVRKKADCLALMDRNQEAVQYLEEKLHLYPDYTDLVYRLGLLYMENNDLIKATRCFLKCLSMGESPPHYPHEEGINSYLAYQALGNAYELMLEKDRALNAYRCQLACKPTDLQPVASILRLLLTENDPDTAVAYLRTWFDFSTSAAYLGVADIFLLHYCPSAALEFLSRAADMGATGDYYCALRGEALLLLGRYQEALSELEKVAQDSPYYLRTVRNKCLLYWLKGSSGEARSLIEHQWPPDVGRELYWAAHLLLESQISKFHAPLNSSVYLGLFLDLTEKCICLKRWDLIERLSTWAEDLPELRTVLGRVLYRRGFHDKAADWLEKGYQFALSAGDKDALLSFARILRKHRKYHESEKVLKAASDRLPLDLAILVELVDLYIEQAAEALRQVPGAGPLIRGLKMEARPRLSVCMIAKDEAEFLPRCLSSIRDIADEIVVVDTGSSDQTPQIALMNGARLFRIKWTHDFASARNFALDQATGDWILIIDADEELNPSDGDKIRKLMHTEGIEGVCVQIVNYYGQQAGPDFMTDIACRLFRNRPHYRFRRALHEQVVDQIIARSGPSSVKIANIKILHYGYLTPVANRKKKLERNLSIIEKAILSDPQNKFLRYSLGVELLNAGRYEEALHNLETCYQPGLSYSSDVVLKKAVCLKQLSRFDEALSFIEESVLLYPQFTDLVFLQGEILLQLSQWEKAIACFKQCLQLGDAPVVYCGVNGVGGFRAWDLLGQALESSGRYPEAEQAYQQAVAANPRYHQPFYRWARLLRRRQKPTEVAETLKSHLDLSNAYSLLLLADVLMSTSDYQEAIGFVESAIKKAPTNRAVALRGLFMKALCLSFLRRFAEASAVLEGIPTDSQYYIPSLIWRYTLALASGVWDSAEDVLRQIIEKDHALGQTYLTAHRLIRGQSGGQPSSNPELAALLQGICDRLVSLQATEMASQVQGALLSLTTI